MIPLNDMASGHPGSSRGGALQFTPGTQPENHVGAAATPIPTSTNSASLTFGSSSTASSTSQTTSHPSTSQSSLLSGASATSHLTTKNIQLPNFEPIYKEICVKHKQYNSRHKEVQVVMHENDYQFFKRVKDAYLEIRCPRWNVFFKPFRINHVQFSVQSMGKVVGIFNHDGPIIPPAEEVKNGSYHYDPCPWAGEPVPSSIILHELNSPKTQLHESRTWLKRIPKKRNASIFSIPDPDDAAIGYGIHIIEGYDGVFLSILGILGVLIATVATGLWWGKGNPGDIQGATGLGSLILSCVLALIVCYQIVPTY